MRPPASRWRWAGALFAAATAAGCGSGAGFPEPRPGDYPPIKTTLLDAPFELAPGASVAIALPHPASKGDVFATIDWTHTANNVVAAFGGPSCRGVNEALAGGCQEGFNVGRPSTCPAKPRVLTANVFGNVPVRLYVANAGLSAESGRVQLTLCQDAPDCGAGFACGQCSSESWRTESCQ